MTERKKQLTDALIELGSLLARGITRTSARRYSKPADPRCCKVVDSSSATLQAKLLACHLIVLDNVGEKMQPGEPGRNAGGKREESDGVLPGGGGRAFDVGADARARLDVQRIVVLNGTRHIGAGGELQNPRANLAVDSATNDDSVSLQQLRLDLGAGGDHHSTRPFEFDSAFEAPLDQQLLRRLRGDNAIQRCSGGQESGKGGVLHALNGRAVVSHVMPPPFADPLPLRHRGPRSARDRAPERSIVLLGRTRPPH